MDSGNHRRLIERCRLLSGCVVTAMHTDDDPASVALQPRSLHHLIVKTHQHRADRAEAVLDHGVGGESGRNGDQRYVLAADPCGQTLQHRPGGCGQPDGQIPVRGERLGAGDDPPVAVERYCVRVSTACVETDPDLRREICRQSLPRYR